METVEGFRLHHLLQLLLTSSEVELMETSYAALGLFLSYNF